MPESICKSATTPAAKTCLRAQVYSTTSITLLTGPGLSQWVRRALEIRRTGYDLTINEFHSHSWKLALLVAASGARFRAGHVTSPGWSKRFSRFSFIFNLPVVMREDEHEIERYLDLVAAIGREENRAFRGEDFHAPYGR